MMGQAKTAMCIGLAVAALQAPVVWDQKNLVMRIILLVSYLIFTGFWIARWASAINAQTMWNDTPGSKDSVAAYDAACLNPQVADWSDNEKAAEYIKEIGEDCGSDQDCLDDGTRWSHLYAANGILFICLACVLASHFLGMVCAKFRLICCSIFTMALCLYSFCMIIVTPVYLFSTRGKLCALNKLNSNVVCTDRNDKDCINDDWTYEKDAQLITALWVLQLLFFVVGLALWAYGAYKIKQGLGMMAQFGK